MPHDSPHLSFEFALDKATPNQIEQTAKLDRILTRHHVSLSFSLKVKLILKLQAIFEAIPRDDEDTTGSAKPSETGFIGSENDVPTFSDMTTGSCRCQR